MFQHLIPGEVLDGVESLVREHRGPLPVLHQHPAKIRGQAGKEKITFTVLVLINHYLNS